MDNCTGCDLSIPVPLTRVVCDETILRIEVVDSETMLPVPGVTVEVILDDSEPEEFITDENGVATTDVEPMQEYTVKIKKDGIPGVGYFPKEEDVPIECEFDRHGCATCLPILEITIDRTPFCNETHKFDITVQTNVTGSLEGVPNAKITFKHNNARLATVGPVETDESGRYINNLLHDGEYTMYVEAEDYDGFSFGFVIDTKEGCNDTEVILELTPAEMECPFNMTVTIIDPLEDGGPLADATVNIFIADELDGEEVEIPVGVGLITDNE